MLRNWGLLDSFEITESKDQNIGLHHRWVLLQEQLHESYISVHFRKIGFGICQWPLRASKSCIKTKKEMKFTTFMLSIPFNRKVGLGSQTIASKGSFPWKADNFTIEQVMTAMNLSELGQRISVPVARVWVNFISFWFFVAPYKSHQSLVSWG